MNFIVANIDDDSMISEIVNPKSLIEDCCFKAIKYSLKVAVIPIRKFLILFYLFLRFLLGKEPGKNHNFSLIQFHK
jgi:hypothetical protein